MATDAEIRNAGLKYVPKQEYLENPYELPVEEETAPVPGGITNTNAFTNSGNNDQQFYTGGTNNLISDFQSAIDSRQKRLNKPYDTSTFTGKISDFMNPQSANQIMADGYEEPKFQPGILSAILGKIDNYRNLRGVDQAFIAQNMGYTGPTVFGENNIPNKDPFGINVRSAFGNYGEYVGEKATSLEEALEDAKNKDMYNKGGKFNKALYDKNTKLLRTKLGFYRNKVKEKNLLQKQQEDQAQQEINPTGASNAPGGTAGGRRDRFTKDGGMTYDNSSGDFRNADGSNVSQDFNNTSASLDNYDASALYADGGRAGYFFGGRARLQGGGGADMGAPEKAAERASKGYGTAPDTGSKSGTNDYSSFEQNVNHQKAMRYNQKEKPSTLENVMNLGSELSYLNNLKNLNVPAIALNFGVNRFRNYIKNKNLPKEDKLSYNTNPLPTDNYIATTYDTPDGQLPYSGDNYDYNKGMLNTPENPETLNFPTNNYTAKLVGPALAQMRTLEKAKGMEQFGGPFSTEQQEGLNKLKQMDQEETIYSQPIFVGANGGRAMFKNGGLASIL